MRVSVRSLLVPAGLLALLSLGSPVAAASALRLGRARAVGPDRVALPVKLERGTGKVAALNFTLRYNDAARLVPRAVVPGPVVERAAADLASAIDLQESTVRVLVVPPFRPDFRTLRAGRVATVFFDVHGIPTAQAARVLTRAVTLEKVVLGDPRGRELHTRTIRKGR